MELNKFFKRAVTELACAKAVALASCSRLRACILFLCAENMLEIYVRYVTAVNNLPRLLQTIYSCTFDV